MVNRGVNDRQLEVLRRIADGPSDDAMVDTSFKASAVALMNRGLATVSKRGGGWRVSITEAGTYYLEHLRYPGEEPITPAPRKPRRPAPAPEPQTGKPVAPRLRNKRHQPIEGLTSARLHVAPSLVSRALQAAWSLVERSEARGWTVLATKGALDQWGNPWPGDDLFVIDTGEHLEGIRIGQQVPRRWAPTADTPTPPKRLFVDIGHHFDGRRAHWMDGKRERIEDRLDEVLDAIAERSDSKRERRLAAEHDRFARQRRERTALKNAVERLREGRRFAALSEQTERWHGAVQVREFLAAMAQRIETLTEPDEIAAAQGWMEWCRATVPELDPLEEPIRFPDEPQPTIEDLMPYLPDWMTADYAEGPESLF
jgi:hypothetical protein